MPLTYKFFIILLLVYGLFTAGRYLAIPKAVQTSQEASESVSEVIVAGKVFTIIESY